MYKTHLNHILVPYESYIHKADILDLNIDDLYESFKCAKCNRIIFNYIDLENNKNNMYWYFPNGNDFYKYFHGWQILQLTCEEQIIKTLLE